MIAWLNPLGLVGLLAVIGPILVHLLRRPRAVRVPFPTLQFVQPSRTAAASLRRLADPWLLLVRTGIVAAAAVALAQPVFITPGRLDSWNGRTARAVVIDVSASMERGDAAREAQARAAAEVDAAYAALIIEVTDLQDGIARGARWLASAPPARRELVVISDFQQGALSPRVPETIPEDVGLRAVQVGAAVAEHRMGGPDRLGGGSSEIRLAGDATYASVSTGTLDRGGVRFLSSDEQGTAALVRAVEAAGTPAGDPAEPIALSFNGTALADVRPIEAGWMLRTVIHLAGDRDLQQAAALADASAGDGPDDVWFAVARASDGRPVVRAASSDGALVIDVAADPRAFVSAAALRGALRARHGDLAMSEEEVVRASPAQLAAVHRESAPVGPDAMRHLGASDGRWLWGLALLLLIVEAAARRPHQAPAAEAREHAA